MLSLIALLASQQVVIPPPVEMAQEVYQVQGNWKLRVGEPLLPNGVTIACIRSQQYCIETSVSGEPYAPPTLGVYSALFAPDYITYKNDTPLCAYYVVTIRLADMTASSIRYRKSSAGMCTTLDPRLDMVLVPHR